MTKHDINPDSSTSRVSAAYLRGLYDYLLEQDVDAGGFLLKFGLSEADLENFQIRLPTSLFHEMLVAAGELLQDPAIGLHVGEQIKPGQYGVLGMSVMNCRTLAQAMARHTRYENLVCNVGRAEYVRHGERVTLLWDNCHDEISAPLAEENLASWVTFARWITGQDLNPDCIRFQHPAPDSIAEHQRLFRCPVAFAQPQIEVEFAASLLELPLRQHDPAMLAMIDDYADKLLLKLNASDSIEKQVQAVISDLLTAGEVSLKSVAEQLSLSERQLQRKLQEAQVNYQSLLDQTRKTLAMRHILNPDFDFSDLTYLLGFADQSAFARAFKKWTGVTPGQFRKAELGT